MKRSIMNKSNECIEIKKIHCEECRKMTAPPDIDPVYILANCWIEEGW